MALWDKWVSAVRGSYPTIDEAAEPSAFATPPAPAQLVAAPSAPEAIEQLPPSVVVFNFEDLPDAPSASSGYVNNGVRWGFDDGEKFFGGYGPTVLLFKDYWTLRARSAELFNTNLYARGLIRRMITNEINDGLHVEHMPVESILGYEEEELVEWAEEVEVRHELWCCTPALCDVSELITFGQMQAVAKQEALVEGDILVVVRQNPATGFPRVQHIQGSLVRSALDQEPKAGNTIREGVETDSMGRHVAYWITQNDGTSKRIPAWGEKSGRRLAWLVYGTDKRMNEVRGTPLLGIVLQSLKEIDRYRDATLRKAVVNSMLAGWVKKSVEAMGTRSLTGAAVRKGEVSLQSDSAEAAPRSFKVMDLIPGVFLEELQAGEEPVPNSSGGTDEKFGAFEEAIIQAIAWINGYPPEILRLSFSSNYSASQAAINELKMELNRVRAFFAAQYCHPIFIEWLVSAAQARKIGLDAARRTYTRKMLEAWRDPAEADLLAAWTFADWAGAIKPAVDISKLVGGYEAMIKIGAMTHDRAARELTGMKFRRNAPIIAREAKILAEAIAPLTALESAKGRPPADSKPEDDGDTNKDDRESDKDDAEPQKGAGKGD